MLKAHTVFLNKCLILTLNKLCIAEVTKNSIFFLGK